VAQIPIKVVSTIPWQLNSKNMFLKSVYILEILVEYIQNFHIITHLFNIDKKFIF